MAEVKKLGWNNVKVLTSSPGRTGIVLQVGGTPSRACVRRRHLEAVHPTSGPGQRQEVVRRLQKKYTNEADENALLSYAYTDVFREGGAGPAGPDHRQGGQALQTGALVPIFYDKRVFKGGHQGQYVEIDQVKGGAWTSLTKPMQ